MNDCPYTADTDVHLLYGFKHLKVAIIQLVTVHTSGQTLQAWGKCYVTAVLESV
jgi:hypothetical protein